MSQRISGYERIERDLYETPEWVTAALIPHLPPMKCVWEPAAGSGKMADALEKHGKYDVKFSDIEDGSDFLLSDFTEWLASDVGKFDAIITNPPYADAEAFIIRALDLTGPIGLVAMLLRTDFDHAKTRQHLFGENPNFAKKIVLTKRIKWFDDSKGSPSFNHAWFIWDWRHSGPPILAYGP